MKKLICFDFDGTLCDSWPPFEQAAIRYTQDAKLPDLCIESLRVGYGYPDEYEFWKGMPRVEQRTHLDRLYRMIDDPTHDIMSGLFPTLFDGVMDTLENLQAKDYTLALVTARPKEPLQVILDHHDLEKHFRGMRTYDDHKLRGERVKPYPDQLISVIKELNFTPEQTIMIGDTCMDMKMGNAAGTTTVGVCWGNHCKERLGEAGANHIVSNHFSDLADIIDAT